MIRYLTFHAKEKEFGMIYTLMHFDTPLIVFSAEKQAETNIRIIEVHEESKELFPLDLAEISERGIESWIKHRSIPKTAPTLILCSPPWG